MFISLVYNRYDDDVTLLFIAILCSMSANHLQILVHRILNNHIYVYK